jgi:hypothetical protein
VKNVSPTIREWAWYARFGQKEFLSSQMPSWTRFIWVSQSKARSGGVSALEK